jgi:hypothetical protein
VFDRSGLTIEVAGFVSDFPIKVDLTNQVPGLRTVHLPETNESWRLFVSHLDGGWVFVGVTPPEDITNVDKRLQETAEHFGTSLRDALLVKNNEIDKNINYALVKDDGTIANAAGGIPLKAVITPVIAQNKFTEVISSEGATYGALSVPVLGTSGRSVGNILVFDEIPPNPWYVLRNWLMNLSSSGLLALFGTLISIPYLGDEFRPEKLLERALQSGESATIEFKQALRWDQWLHVKEGTGSGKRKLPDAEGIAIKNVAAFLNSETGGTLFIGITDDKHVVGLEKDYQSLGKRESRDKDRDRFQVHLGNLLSQKLGRELTSLCVNYSIVDHDGTDVCVVRVDPSPRPVFISEGDVKTFYIRQGASTAALDVEKAVAYIDRRWPKTLWKMLGNRIRTVRT